MTEQLKAPWELPAELTSLLDMVPHALQLLLALGPFGLEPRLREITALTIARTLDCPRVVGLHRLVGRAAGLTESELEGALDGLTSAELSAIALGLGTVGLELPGDLSAPCADEHYTYDQITQLQAVGLATALHCRLARRICA
jgi:alkylhydroperoxidase family enzyme